MAQQLDREFALERPAQDVGVEQVPRARWLDDRALPRPRTDQALGRQHLDRFAGDRAADGMRLGDFRFGRKGPLLVAAGHDRPPERVEHPVREVAPDAFHRWIMIVPAGHRSFVV